MLATLWFCLAAITLTGFVLLDGFDLGAGIVQLFVARTEVDRSQILQSIGPVWDGNEVWLLVLVGSGFPGSVRISIQWFLSRVNDRALVVNSARHLNRIPRSRG